MKHVAFAAAIAAAIATAAIGPSPAFAQDAAPAASQGVIAAPALAAAPAAPVTPMIRADVAGIRQPSAAADTHAVDAVASAQGGLHQGEGVALMVVGGAAMVGGLIVGGNSGTAVALGGLAIGLVGLYQYVR